MIPQQQAVFALLHDAEVLEAKLEDAGITEEAFGKMGRRPSRS